MVFCGDRKSSGRGIEEGNGGADEGKQSTIIILQLVARSWTATSTAQGKEGNGNEQARQKTGFSRRSLLDLIPTRPVLPAATGGLRGKFATRVGINGTLRQRLDRLAGHITVPI